MKTLVLWTEGKGVEESDFWCGRSGGGGEEPCGGNRLKEGVEVVKSDVEGTIWWCGGAVYK